MFLFFKRFPFGIVVILIDESRLLQLIDLLLIGVLVADDTLLKSTDFTTLCLPSKIPLYNEF